MISPWLRAWQRVAEIYELDLLHVHYAIPHSVSALLARQMLAGRGLRLPFITTLHGTDITLVGLDRSYLPITKFGIEQSDGRDRHLRPLGPTAPARPLPSPARSKSSATSSTATSTSASREKVAEERPRYAEPGEHLIVHLSNFRPVKRVMDVVEVFARVTKQVPGAPSPHWRRP